ncbi:hypothetical protein [uncultured Brevibacillus sp.]|uniref:hypothetical protein n=1 Tax=uncultured Brevibacillus sp. TaxID=169970 RepID=UPI002594D3A0|nr:hypothetical protein [uncultured Brevibacillus sp.]
MKYRQRKPDGTFGDIVETPGHYEGMSPEMQSLFEALIFMDREMTSMKEEFTNKISALETELQGGE